MSLSTDHDDFAVVVEELVLLQHFSLKLIQRSVFSVHCTGFRVLGSGCRVWVQGEVPSVLGYGLRNLALELPRTNKMLNQPLLRSALTE